MGDTIMIGYPNKKKITNKQMMQEYGRRGMSLEEDINQSNQFYNESNRALIHKKPTPIQVVKVDYPKRSCAKIKEAYYKTPSTTDYNGIYRGRYIDFEVKETLNKTSFPIRNIHSHQIKHLQKVLLHQGIGFFIIRFRYWNETFFIEAKYIIDIYISQEKKSISYNDIKKHGMLLKEGWAPRLNYLDVIDTLYFKEVLHYEAK